MPDETTHDEADWLPEALAAIEGLRDLKGNWDGYGAAPSDPELRAAAKQLLECLHATMALRPPQIVPTRIGGVQFEWNCANREMEIEVEWSRDEPRRLLASWVFEDLRRNSLAYDDGPVDPPSGGMVFYLKHTMEDGNQ